MEQPAAFRIDPGPTLAQGADGEQVTFAARAARAFCRTRFERSCTGAVTAYQQVHGLKPDANRRRENVITSLNRGELHYAQVLMINMERARTAARSRRAEAAHRGRCRVGTHFQYENGSWSTRCEPCRFQKTQTPMMAALIRYAARQPLLDLLAPSSTSTWWSACSRAGVSYLSERKYEVFAD